MADLYGYTIFCDDIRDEVGGKTSLMGRYVGALSIGASPPIPGSTFALPKFAVSTNLIAPKDYRVERIRVVVSLVIEGAEPKILAQVETTPPTELADDADMMLVGVNFLIAPLVLAGDCSLKVRGYFDGLEVKAGTLKVNFIPQPAA